MGCSKTSFDEVDHALEGREYTLEDIGVKAEAERAKGNHGVYHAVIIGLGVDEGDSGR